MTHFIFILLSASQKNSQQFTPCCCWPWGPQCSPWFCWSLRYVHKRWQKAQTKHWTMLRQPNTGKQNRFSWLLQAEWSWWLEEADISGLVCSDTWTTFYKPWHRWVPLILAWFCKYIPHGDTQLFALKPFKLYKYHSIQFWCFKHTLHNLQCLSLS